MIVFTIRGISKVDLIVRGLCRTIPGNADGNLIVYGTIDSVPLST